MPMPVGVTGTDADPKWSSLPNYNILTGACKPSTCSTTELWEMMVTSSILMFQTGCILCQKLSVLNSIITLVKVGNLKKKSDMQPTTAVCSAFSGKREQRKRFLQCN
jgi:hypothetical protein